MAQQDTGLGWSAKDSYLMQAGPIQMGVQSEMTDPNGVMAVIPGNLSTDAEVAAGGYCYAENTTYRWMCAVDSDLQVFAFQASAYIVFAGLATAYVKSVRVKKSDGTISRSDRRATCNTVWQSTSLRYGYVTMGTGNWEVPSSATYHLTKYTYTTYLSEAINEGMSQIGLTSQNWYKLNPGYAVCCFCTYYDTYGGLIRTPVLISTNFSSTILSNDGTTQATFVTYSYLHDGVRFYMSMVPTDTVIISSSTVVNVSLTNFRGLFPQGVFNALMSQEWANVRILESVNPYGPPTASNEGGDGEEDTGDPIPFSTTPTTSSVSSGFLTLFMPSILTLNSLAGYMWSNPLFDPSAIKKLFADPMDAILSLHIVPVKPSTTGVKTISVAGIATDFSSSYTTEQFVTVYCGSVYVPKKFGSYLDYSPYTQTELFLPFIGFRPVDIDDIQGKTVYLQYQVDILSGACIAELKASMDDANSSVIYSWTGNCAVQIPVTGADFKSAFATAITAAASLGAAVATGGAAAPLTTAGLASTAVNSTGLKPRVQRSGAMIGSAGFMGQRTPFIVRSNPNIALPPRQEHFTGYPSFDTLLMSSLTGYNVVAEVHLEGVPATDAEMDEIERLLKEGVIF